MNGAFDASDRPFQHETRRHWRHTAIFAGLIQPAGYYTVITARTAPGSGDHSPQVPHTTRGKKKEKKGVFRIGDAS